jgi:hypothetical protein
MERRAWYRLGQRPGRELTLILLTQQAFTSHLSPTISRDFWTTAYRALED